MATASVGGGGGGCSGMHSLLLGSFSTFSALSHGALQNSQVRVFTPNVNITSAGQDHLPCAVLQRRTSSATMCALLSRQESETLVGTVLAS